MDFLKPVYEKTVARRAGNSSFIYLKYYNSRLTVVQLFISLFWILQLRFA